MPALPSSLQQLDQTKGWQKALAIIMLLGLAYGVMIGVNAIAPTIIAFCDNFFKILLVGVPTLFVIYWIATNPYFIWSTFKTLSWNLTKFMISMDKLSVMDRYADYLDVKKGNLDKRRETLRGYWVNLGRQIDGLQKEMKDNLRHGSAALSDGQKQVASLDGIKVNANKQSITNFQPIYDKMKIQLDNLKELSDNWGFSIQQIRYVNSQKRMEYQTLREAAKACGEAKEFLRGDTDAAKIYNESIKQMEQAVSGYTAKIDQFEEDAKPIMDDIRVEKKMNMDDGMKAIEAYMQDGQLMLPDFSEKFLKTDGDTTVLATPTKVASKKYF